MTDTKDEFPDIYSDRFNVMISSLGVNLYLSRSAEEAQGKPTPVATLRFSLENWKLILMTARHQMKNHETAGGNPIFLPASLLSTMGLSAADW